VITVRPASEADIAGLLAVEDEFASGGMASWQIMDEAFFKRKIAREELLVGLDDETVVAWLCWTTLWRLPWIEFVRVMVAHRRQGFGRKLVQFLEDKMREANAWMLLSSSSGAEKDAIAWHRAIGFEDGGRIDWAMFPGAPPEVLHFRRLW
jgi:GNAT superfamily N-acetyltransferase